MSGVGRLDDLTSWHADWRGLRVGVLGLGVTGFAVADTLVELGAQVLVVASRGAADQIELLDVIGSGFAQHEDLSTPPQALVDLDPELLIVSPGFHPDHPLLAWAADRGVPLWGDIELAWRLRDKVGEPADWILVTGTNGKTTTTQLTASILAADGVRVAPVGNIGTPVLDAIRDPEGFQTLVVELSSYQLHALPLTGPGALHPLASVCLNLADDHLDWHGSADAYRSAKGKVYENTRVACVYNKDDEATRRMVEEADVEDGARAIGFGLGMPGPSDFGLVEDLLVDRAFLENRRDQALELVTLDELRAVGLGAPHLVADVLAASALARAAGVPAPVVREALLGFRVDRHRTETVAVAAEVRWVDDSKATNPHAAEASLRAFDSVVWIVGGQLKGVEIAPLVQRHAKRLSAVVLIGTEREPLREAFARHAPAVTLLEASSADTEGVMPDAVRLSAEVARPGDTVLLAPSAASFDQFEGYADRGRRFAAAVQQFLGGDADGPEAAHRAPRD